jgi:hypothetical protein
MTFQIKGILPFGISILHYYKTFDYLAPLPTTVGAGIFLVVVQGRTTDADYAGTLQQRASPVQGFSLWSLYRALMPKMRTDILISN